MPYKECSREETRNAFKQLAQLVDTIFEERHLKINQNKVLVEKSEDDSGMWIACEELFNPIKKHLEAAKEASKTDDLTPFPLDSVAEINVSKQPGEMGLKRRSERVAGKKGAKTMKGWNDNIACN